MFHPITVSLVVASALAQSGRFSPTHNELVPLSHESASHWRHPLRCGVACCYAFLRIEGSSTDYESVAGVMLVDDARGTSLADLCETLCSFGQQVEVIRATPDELRNLEFPAIAHLDMGRTDAGPSGHYVVLLSADASKVSLLEPTSCTIRTLPVVEFSDGWTGFLVVKRSVWNSSSLAWFYCLTLVALLVLSTRMCSWAACTKTFRRNRKRWCSVACLLLILMAESGCRKEDRGDLIGDASTTKHPQSTQMRRALVASERIQHVGALAPLRDVEVRFQIENLGQEEAEINLGVPSCGCASAQLTHDTIAPLGQTELLMVVRNDGRAGEFRASCDVSDSSNTWRQTFEVVAVGLGSWFPSTAVEWRKPVTNPVRRLEGFVVTKELDTHVDVDCEIELPNGPADAVHIERCQIGHGSSLVESAEHRVIIELHGDAESIEKLSRPVLGTLVLTVRCTEFEQQHRIPLAFATQWKGL